MLAALTRLRQLCCHPRLVVPATAHAGSSKAGLRCSSCWPSCARTATGRWCSASSRSFLDAGARHALRQRGLRVPRTSTAPRPAEARARARRRLPGGEADVFLISLKAGGTGLNLTAADYVIHLDPWWNPAVEDQATDRAHRIGQDKPVTVVRLVARDTIEEAVLALHDDKRALAAGVLEGSDVAASLGTEELIELIRRARM